MNKTVSINTIKGLLDALADDTPRINVDLANFQRILFLMRQRQMPIPAATVICHCRQAYVTFQGYPSTIVTVSAPRNLTKTDFSRLHQLTFCPVKPEQSKHIIYQALFKKPVLKVLRLLKSVFAAMEAAEAAARNLLATASSLKL